VRKSSPALSDLDVERWDADSDCYPETRPPAALRRQRRTFPNSAETGWTGPFVGDASWRCDFAGGECYVILWTFYPWKRQDL